MLSFTFCGAKRRMLYTRALYKGKHEQSPHLTVVCALRLSFFKPLHLPSTIMRTCSKRNRTADRPFHMCSHQPTLSNLYRRQSYSCHSSQDWVYLHICGRLSSLSSIHPSIKRASGCWLPAPGKLLSTSRTATPSRTHSGCP